MKARISLVAAMARNRVIGRDNRLPWSLSEDLKRFKELTSGHPLILGRKTYESIGRLLPNRTTIIVTRQPDFQVPGALMASSLEDAIARASELDEEIFIAGGGEIYAQAWPRADRIHLTVIDQDIPGDAYFPELDWDQFREVSREDHSAPLPFSFRVYERRTPEHQK